MILSKPNHSKDEYFLRAASPNERRCITRESLDFYRTLVLGCTYEFPTARLLDNPSAFAHALRRCVDQHALLATIIKNSNTESPYFAFCPQIDLNQHIQIRLPLSLDQDEIKTIQRELPGILDEPWDHSTPPWKIIVFPFSQTRCFVAFAYSHGFLDGMCGMAFHRTFHDALQEGEVEQALIFQPQRKQISSPFDTPKNLKITWSYLISPVLGAYLPKSLASMFGFNAAVITAQEGTWTGTTIFVPKEYRTEVQIISIDADELDKVLTACRENGAKLTGFIHELIIEAFSKNLPQQSHFNSLISGSAMNMRKTIGVSDDTMGMFVSGDYELHEVSRSNVEANNKATWELAKQITVNLISRSRDLVDQPVGLLRYLTSIRPWLLAKIGQRRDSSYEVSNVGSFKPIQKETACKVADMVFCQPAALYGPPLHFNVVSVAGGPLHIAVNWQPAALDLGSHADEVRFVEKICEHVKRGFSLP